MNDEAILQLRTPDGRREGEGQTFYVATLKRFSEYSKWIVVMVSGTVVAYYPVREDITERARGLYFSVCRVLLRFTFSDGLALMLLISYLLPRGRSSERLYILAEILIHITGVLMMLTSVSLLLLLNQSYAMVTIPVLPVMAIVIIVFYKGINTGLAREVTDYEAHQSELIEFLDLAASVTGAAFAGMISTIFGYFKNFSIDQADVKFSVTFIFFTVFFGLLAMLLTTVPPSLRRPNARSRFITFIKVLSYSLIGLLALSGLAVAAEFLEEFTLLAFLPIFFALVVWFIMEFIQQEDGTSQAHSATGNESQPDTSTITITAFSFAALMAVYSVYFGSEVSGFHLKTCTFFLSLAFMSSLSWMLLAFRPPRTQSLAMTVTILTCSTIGSLVVAMLDLIFLAIREGKRQH